MYQEYFYLISDDFRKKHFSCDYGTPPKVVKIQQSRSIMILFGNHTLNSTGVSKFTWSTVLFCEYRSLINKSNSLSLSNTHSSQFSMYMPFFQIKAVNLLFSVADGSIFICRGFKHATF